jgi:hypothetical protein
MVEKCGARGRTRRPPSRRRRLAVPVAVLDRVWASRVPGRAGATKASRRGWCFALWCFTLRCGRRVLDRPLFGRRRLDRGSNGGLPLGRWGSDGRRHGRRRCPAHGLGDLAVGLAVGCILALRRALLGRRGGLFLCPSLIVGEDEDGEAQDKHHQQGKGPPALQVGPDGRVPVWLPEGQKPSHTSYLSPRLRVGGSLPTLVFGNPLWVAHNPKLMLRFLRAR